MQRRSQSRGRDSSQSGQWSSGAVTAAISVVAMLAALVDYLILTPATHPVIPLMSLTAGVVAGSYVLEPRIGLTGINLAAALGVAAFCGLSWLLPVEPVPPAGAAGLLLTVALQAFVARRLAQRMTTGEDWWLLQRSLRGVAAIAIACALVAVPVSLLLGRATDAAWPPLYAEIFASNVAGLLGVGAVAYRSMMRLRQFLTAQAAGRGEEILLWLAGPLVTMISFLPWADGYDVHYVALAFVTWGGLRLSSLSAICYSLLLAMIAAAMSATGAGPFVAESARVGVVAADVAASLFCLTLIVTGAITSALHTDSVAAQCRLRAMTVRQLDSDRDLRREVADQLHDEVGQMLVAARLALDAGERATPQDIAATHIERAKNYVANAQDAVRQLLLQVNPVAIENLGLHDALRRLAEAMQTEFGLTVHLDLKPAAPGPVATEHAFLLFRAARELLRNVIKHAGVDEAWLRVEEHAEQVELEVFDLGRGFSIMPFAALAVTSGYGLFSVKDRVQSLGGTFQLISARDAGCRARVRLPASLRQHAHGLADPIQYHA